jgi:hypothetical protein
MQFLEIAVGSLGLNGVSSSDNGRRSTFEGRMEISGATWRYGNQN